MKVAITGATGNIGIEVLKQILPLEFIDQVNVLLRQNKSKNKKIVEFCKVFPQKLKFFYGDMLNKEVLTNLVKDVDVVFNLAGIIPPHSDVHPKKAIECNEIGVDNIVTILEKNNPHALFVETTSVAVYGHRNPLHPYVEVGDPLLIGAGDMYALTKMRAEFRILESSLSHWVIFRESAVLHDNLLKGNISDGIMFHTAFNSPLEWVSARDTAILFKNMLIKHNSKLLGNEFYKKVFNIGNKNNRISGYETLRAGFSILDADTKDFFEPNFNTLRNFHGVWFRDSDVLENMFNFQNDTIESFWNEIKNKNKIFALGKIVPKKLIKKLVIEKLFSDINAPRYWVNHHDEAKIKAFFYDLDTYNKIPKTFDDFKLFHLQKNYNEIRKDINYNRINLYFDTTKKDEDITIEDLINVAHAHGGELLDSNFIKGDMYQKLRWKTQHNEEFIATPYTILRAGHWFNESYYKYEFHFDELAKKDKIYAQIYYDYHRDDENNLYYYDEDFNFKVTQL